MICLVICLQFSVFLLVDSLSITSAENRKITDLDIHCVMGEADRCVCYDREGIVLRGKLIGAIRLRWG